MTITVFLADDHTVLREGLAFLLAAEPDIEVVGAAANGRDAVARIEQLSPDVAVLDIAMPELNGLEATRRLRHVSPETRVVILSMHSAPKFVTQALQIGVRGYVLKEAASQEVLRAVRAVAEGQRFLSPSVADMVIASYGTEVRAGDAGPLEKLTSREREVLQLVVEGKTSAEIAETLSLSLRTIQTYRSRIMSKLDIHDVPGLVKFAIRHGLTSIE
jgi:DNA-binding NarL/FixJ family response regulator